MSIPDNIPEDIWIELILSDYGYEIFVPFAQKTKKSMRLTSLRSATELNLTTNFALSWLV